MLHTDHPGMTTFDPPRGFQLWKAALATGLLAVIVGVVILAWPGISVLVASVLFGVYLLLIGGAQLFLALTLPMSTAGRILFFVSGAAALILAILAFRHFGQDYAVLLLAIWVGIGFIFRGVAATVAAISDPAIPGRGWQIFFGVITLIAGIVVLAAPLASIVTLAIVVGVWLIVIGVFEVVSAFVMRRGGTRIPVKTGTPSRP
ncbi:MAG: hypothetical protein JWR37_944 [Mycobacterium sp.]|nr:hypothetical protein [Mycobacterium sp.]